MCTHQFGNIRPLGMVVGLVACLTLPVSVWAAPPSSNSGQPFAEMAAQHDMIKQGVADVESNLGGQIQEVKDLLEGQSRCGAGTKGQRFVVNGPEVCDNTTGLYWEQSPSTNIFVWSSAEGPINAKDHCANLNLGNGWSYRLAEMQELSSLVDYSIFNQADALNTPNGPFSNVQGERYWSGTEAATEPISAWVVFMAGGVRSPLNKPNILFAWCVR